MAKERIYPVGVQTFSDIIEEGMIYVDKTALIYNMAKKYKNVKIGIFGLHRGLTFVKTLKRIKGVQLVSVCEKLDAEIEKAKEKLTFVVENGNKLYAVQEARQMLAEIEETTLA